MQRPSPPRANLGYPIHPRRYRDAVASPFADDGRLVVRAAELVISVMGEADDTLVDTPTSASVGRNAPTNAAGRGRGAVGEQIGRAFRRWRLHASGVSRQPIRQRLDELRHTVAIGLIRAYPVNAYAR